MALTKNQTVNSETEIRKLQPMITYKLTMLLNWQDSWEKLMAIVPKEDGSGECKFNREHFSLIEQESRQRQKGCAEIFLDEWGTMGRKRPTVGKLLDLLTKAELYRAADYIAINVLNKKEGPKRPVSGPAAQINISSLLREEPVNDTEDSFALIKGDVYSSTSHQNEVPNPRECVPEGEEVSPNIPRILEDTGSSFTSEETESSEIEGGKHSSKLPLCLQDLTAFSQSVEICSSKTTSESSQNSSTDESLNTAIPRLVLDYTISE